MLKNDVIIIIEPEIYQMMQAIKRNGSGMRFFGEDNTFVMDLMVTINY